MGRDFVSISFRSRWIEWFDTTRGGPRNSPSDGARPRRSVRFPSGGGRAGRTTAILLGALALGQLSARAVVAQPAGGSPDEAAPAPSPLPGAPLPAPPQAHAEVGMCGLLVVKAGVPMVAPLAVSCARRALPDAALATGMASDGVVRELHRHLCQASGMAQGGTRVCAPLMGGGTLVQLRDRVALDAAELPLVYLRASGAADPESRLAATFFETLAGRATCQSLSDFGRAAQAQVGGNGDPALLVLLNVLEALLRADGAAPERVALATLAELRGSTHGAADVTGAAPQAQPSEQQVAASLTPEQHAALALLSTELRGLVASSQGAGTEIDLTERLRRWIEGYRQARVLVGDPSGPVLPALLQTLSMLEQARFVEAATPWVVSGTPGMPAPGTVGVAVPALSVPGGPGESQLAFLGQIERLLRASGEDARWRLLRSSVLGTGEWLDHLAVDGTAAVALVDTKEGDYGLSADLSLGWQTDRWGVVASGAMRAYQTTGVRVYEDTDRVSGGFEGWMGSDPTQPWIWEGRVSMTALDYASNRFLSGRQFDEVSTMLRGGLMAGLRYERSRFGIGLWGGAGGQYEYYDSIDFGGRSQDVRDEVGLALEGRLLARWSFWPRMLVFRSAAQGARFRMTRRRETTDLPSGASSSTRAQRTQVELSARGYLDFELARFMGFVPALAGGVDWMMRRSEDDRESSVVPVLGAGIRRLWF